MCAYHFGWKWNVFTEVGAITCVVCYAWLNSHSCILINIKNIMIVWNIILTCLISSGYEVFFCIAMHLDTVWPVKSTVGYCMGFCEYAWGKCNAKCIIAVLTL